MATWGCLAAIGNHILYQALAARGDLGVPPHAAGPATFNPAFQSAWCLRYAGPMKWRFEDMLTFLEVVEAGGVTAAAMRLSNSKSVISKRISDLEAALDVQLFQRSTRQLQLTESGEALFERMRPLIQEIRETTECISSRKTLQGRLRITAPMTFATMFMGPVILDFVRQHPELELALDYDDRFVDLARNGYDVGIRIGTLRDSTLIARKLRQSPRVVCCSPAYAQSRGRPQNLEELQGHDCIGYSHVHTSQLWKFMAPEAGEEPISIFMNSRIVVNNGEAIRDAAIAGLGVVLLPLFLAAEPLRNGKLIQLLPDCVPVPHTIYAIYPPTRHVPTKVRAFIDHLAAYFKTVPPWERDLDHAFSSASWVRAKGYNGHRAGELAALDDM